MTYKTATLSDATISEILADFAISTPSHRIPDDVKKNAWLHLVDTYGIAIMVARSRYADAVAPLLKRPGNSGQTTVWGMNSSASWSTALLVNGILAGSVNLDDTHNESQLHPGAHIIPIALGLGERESLSGTAILDAIAIGNEVACRLACIAPGAFSRRGFHSSSVLGKVYGALIAARLLQLSHTSAVHAVGHAVSQAGGLMQCYLDGTWTLAFHHGWTAVAGVAAAELGEHFPGPREALEGKLGLFNGFLADSGITPDFERSVSDLGSHWENRNMSFKPYATGCVIHPFIDVALELSKEHQLRAEDIRSVTAIIADYLVPIVCEPQEFKRRPADVFNARVSLQHIIANTLVNGCFDLDSLTKDSLQNPKILELAEKVTYEADPSPVHRQHFNGWLQIETKDGRRLERKIAPWLRMHVGQPETAADVEGKFLENTSRVCSRPEEILNLARELQCGMAARHFLTETRRILNEFPSAILRTKTL